MSYNLARPYSRSFKGPIDESLVFETTAGRTSWLTTAEGIAIGYSGMIVSDLQTNKAYILNSSNEWQELASSQLATSSVSGLVKLFSDTTQTQAAQTVSSDANKTYGIQSNSSNQLVVNVPWTDTTFTHPTNGANTTIPAENTKVLSAITVNTFGHVTSVGTKTLAEADIPTLAQSKITNLTTDLSSKVAKSGDTMTGFLTLHSNPTNTFHAATKGYVDAVKQGLDIKDSVKVATTAHLQNTNYNTDGGGIGAIQSDQAVALPNIDNVVLASGDRILVKNQNDPKQNGIYTVVSLGGPAPWRLERSVDANSNIKINPGMFTFVERGSINADTGWVLTGDVIILDDIQSGLISFSQFSAAGQVYDGSGLYKTGNTISVGQGDGISVLADSVAVNSTVLRTSGVQTVTGDKDFGNNFLIKPSKNPESAFFPAFAVEPSGFSQRLTYMSKSELVTALSFETPELGNSFVNTTGNQTISGIKTFVESANFNGNFQPVANIDGYFQTLANINLTNSSKNCITFNASGNSLPGNTAAMADGTKIVFKPSPLPAQPPVAVGLTSTDLWHQVPSSAWNYSWYVGASKIASLSGNGTFETTTIKSTNLYIGNTQVTATATELNLLASASSGDILIASGTDFIKQNIATALTGVIITETLDALTISKNANNLIINHNLSSATDTANNNPNVIQNILIDSYGHITGVSSVDLDDIFLTSSDLNTQISFVSGIGSYYNASTSGLTVFHSGGHKNAGVYGGNGIKSIQLDSYGHIYDISTETYVASGNLCSAISDCTIDGGTY